MCELSEDQRFFGLNIKITVTGWKADDECSLAFELALLALVASDTELANCWKIGSCNAANVSNKLGTPEV